MDYKELREVVYSYPTIYPEGFIQEEMDKLLEQFPNIDMEYFNNTMMGNTCMMSSKNEIITYHTDVLKALQCGLEKRKLRGYEWD